MLRSSCRESKRITIISIHQICQTHIWQIVGRQLLEDRAMRGLENTRVSCNGTARTSWESRTADPGAKPEFRKCTAFCLYSDTHPYNEVRPNWKIGPSNTRKYNVELKLDINIGVAVMRPPGQNGPIRTDSRLRRHKWDITKTIRGAVETYDTLISTLLAIAKVPVKSENHEFA